MGCIIAVKSEDKLEFENLRNPNVKIFDKHIAKVRNLSFESVLNPMACGCSGTGGCGCGCSRTGGCVLHWCTDNLRGKCKHREG